MPIRNVLAVAGKGGNGGVYFARDNMNRRSVGGMGGKGGSVYLSFSKNPLHELTLHQKYAAGDGSNGGDEGARGKSGFDINIVSPRDYIWTSIEDKRSITYSSSSESIPISLAIGGQGGLGNGLMGKDLNSEGSLGESNFYEVNCRIVADFVLFGLPNSGKSTLMKSLSGIQTKISNIPFSTVSPRYFSVRLLGNELIGADTPGIIDLNLINRNTKDLLASAKLVLIMVDLQRKETIDYIRLLRAVIPSGPRILCVGSKCDGPDTIAKYFQDQCDLTISCKSGLGLNKLVHYLIG